MKSEGTTTDSSEEEPEAKRHILSGFQDWLHEHAHIRVFMALVGMVMIWRGTWAFCDKFLFPDHPVISYSASIIIGLILLLIDDFKLDELH